MVYSERFRRLPAIPAKTGIQFEEFLDPRLREDDGMHLIVSRQVNWEYDIR
jgi:hypothetical protein